MTGTMTTNDNGRKQPSLLFHCLLFMLFNSYFGSLFGIGVATGFSLSGMTVLILPLLFINAVPSLILWSIDLALMTRGKAPWLRALSIMLNLPNILAWVLRAWPLYEIDRILSPISFPSSV